MPTLETTANRAGRISGSPAEVRMANRSSRPPSAHCTSPHTINRASPSLPDSRPAIWPVMMMPSPFTAKIRLYICGDTPNIFCRTKDDPDM
ncbi:hypothetical protein D3C76_1634740 [compost metagenome]